MYVYLHTAWVSVVYFQLPPNTTSGVAKAGPGQARARPKFVLLMCVQALVLLVQWLSVQQVPGQYQWLGYSTEHNTIGGVAHISKNSNHSGPTKFTAAIKKDGHCQSNSSHTNKRQIPTLVIMALYY